MKKIKLDKNYLKKLNPMKFFSIVQERTKRFKKGSKNPLPLEYPVNKLARRLHPAKQYVTISKVEKHSEDCRTYTFVADKSKGTEELAYFSAGQYITIFLNINGLKITRAYSLSSAPCSSISNRSGKIGFYQITVKAVKDGLVSTYIHENWKEGTEVIISAPEGNFNYVYLRDAPTVVGIAGGSGITPFLSMAKSIASGDENFNLILLYGNRDKKSILFKEDFDRLSRESDKIKVVYVLSDEQDENYEHGFITAELVKKYTQSPSGQPYSVFLCGPQSMYRFMDEELKKLDLEKKYIRHEMFGEIHSAKTQDGYPGTDSPEVTISVTICDQKYTVKGSADDTILQILEKSGVAVPSRCRSGECGWCHSYLKSGNVFVPKKLDFRRKADFKYGFIHPCCTFALSDLELDIPPAK